MSDEEVVILVKRALGEILPERAAHFEQLSFDWEVEDLGVDSIALVELVGYVEDAIGRRFRTHEVVSVRSIKDIAALIRKEAP